MRVYLDAFERVGRHLYLVHERYHDRIGRGSGAEQEEAKEYCTHNYLRLDFRPRRMRVNGLDRSAETAKLRA